MGEADNRTESDGKSLFIIRNGRRVSKFEAGEWKPLLPGVVVRVTPDGINIEMPKPPAPAIQPMNGSLRSRREPWIKVKKSGGLEPWLKLRPSSPQTTPRCFSFGEW
jgi:hypothetical protein